MKISHLLISASLAFASAPLLAADSASQSTTGAAGTTGTTSGQSGMSSQQGSTGSGTQSGSQSGMGQSQDQQTSGTQSGQSQQLPANMSASRFQALDRNSDGYISRQEAGADKELTVIFMDVDSNRDDQLSSEEFSDYSATGETSN